MSEWQEVKLRECISTLKGFAFKSKWYQSNGVPIVRVSDFTDNSISVDDIEYIPHDLAQEYSRYLLKTKDVVIQTVGSWQHNPASIVGKVVNVPSNLNGALLNQNAVKIIPNKTIDNNFLYYRLKDEHFKLYNLGCAQGAANQASITLSSIGSFRFNLPPLPTQQKIAKILSNYDDLIENNLKRIKLLEESARLTYEEWFLRFRIDGKKLDIDPETKLPFGWEKKSVTECDAFKQDKRKVKEFEGEKKYYATADITETAITADGETINWDNKPSRAQIKPNNNTVWFARMSNTYKVLCFNNKNINLQDNSVISSGFAGFKAKNDLCLPFLYFTINSTFFHELKDLYATGATQVSLNNDSMSFIKIIEPSADLVEEFGSRTLSLIEEISILRSKNQLLKEARDILLPRLMTGMIDTDDMDVAV